MFSKSVRNWLILSVLVLLPACMQQEEGMGDFEEFSFYAEIEEATRSHVDPGTLSSGNLGLVWDSGDRVGAFGSWTRNSLFTISMSGSTAQFSGRVSYGDKLKYAYYPYSAGVTNYRSVPVTIGREQPFTDIYSINGNDIRATNTLKLTRGKYTFTFKTMVSFMRVAFDLEGVSGIDPTERILGYTLTSQNGRQITGDYSLNLTSLTMSATTGYDNVVVDLTADPLVSAGEALSVLCVNPSILAGDTLQMLIETDNHYVSFDFPISARFAAGNTYSYDFSVSQMSEAQNSLSVVAKVPVTEPDPEPTTERQLAWDNGATLEIGGVAYTKAESNLTELYYDEDATINDATLENAIAFVADGVNLYLGTRATIGNTIVVCNTEGGKAGLIGQMKVTSTSASFIGLKDLNLNSYISMEFSGLDNLAVEGCNISAPSYMDCVFDMSGNSGSFDTFSFVGNTVHPTAASSPSELTLVQSAGNVVFDNINVDDNLLLNIKGVDDILFYADGVENLAIRNNHLFYGSSLYDDVTMFESDNNPTGEVSVSGNSYYAAGGTASMMPYVLPMGVTYAAAAQTSPLSSVDIASGTYSYAYYMIDTQFVLDGEVKSCAIDRTANTAVLNHKPTAADLLYCVMPGVKVTTAGSWPSSKTATFSYGGNSETYTYSLPDYVSSSSVQSLNTDGSGWTLVWSDEFTGSDWDREVWTRCPQSTPDWAKEQWPDDESLVQVSGGSLVTWAKKDSDTSKGNNGYITGGIWGKALKSFNLGNGVTGRIDVRAKVTDAKGYWPAIWMMPDQDSFTWPEWGEIDIMEHLNTESIYYTTLHRSEDGGDNKCSASPSYSSRTSWHVFTVLVINDEIRLGMDGVTYLTCKKSDHGVDSSSSTETRKNYWPFDATNYYLILDSQLNGGWVGDADGTNLPAHMDIDYVRYMVKQ